MSSIREEVPAALDGERVDRVVAMLTGLSRAECSALVAAGAVRAAGAAVRARSQRLRQGQLVEIDWAEPAWSGPAADPSVTFPVVHEDDTVVVVDKPAGLVVHPGAGNAAGTLVNGLLARYPDMAGVGDPERPGVVHRLDVGTSGLLVAARTAHAYEHLVGQLSARTVERRYQALVWGEVGAERGVVDAAIGRSRRDPTRMAVSAEGRPARTGYEVTARHRAPAPLTSLACRLETGRTHQIRVHLAAIGHPVVGDDRYGGRRAPLELNRPFLHAGELGFVHPATGALLRFVSPLPAELAEILAGLG
ncbi:MAG: RluA family pseudouridine synthase [Acidimicrobiales bacterium]